MKVGDLVESKWVDGIIGILLRQVESGTGDIVWRILWFGNNVVFEETNEDQEDLEAI